MYIYPYARSLSVGCSRAGSCKEHKYMCYTQVEAQVPLVLLQVAPIFLSIVVVVWHCKAQVLLLLLPLVAPFYAHTRLWVAVHPSVNCP